MLNQKQVLAKLEALKKEEKSSGGRSHAFYGQRASLKYFKRLHVFKASNVFFDPTTLTATSYQWWEMVKVIGGKVVFNGYSYSSSTSKHQSKVRTLLGQLGISVDVTVEARKGLQSLDSAIQDHEKHIEVLKSEIVKPGTRKVTNLNRAALIQTLKAKIEVIKELQRCERIDYDRRAA